MTTGLQLTEEWFVSNEDTDTTAVDYLIGQVVGVFGWTMSDAVQAT